MTMWADIPGYEGLYKISDEGDVLSLPRMGTRSSRPRCLVKCPDSNGYMHVTLHDGKTQRTAKIHRLVASAFVPNPCGYREINHIDEDKRNCRASNLEWCSRAYNVHYGARTQKTSTKVAMYTADGKYIKSFKSIREACREEGYKCPGNISNVLHGKATFAYGHRWEKED